MINTNIISSLGYTLFDSSKTSLPKTKIEAKDPEEGQIVEGFEGDCEQCEQERPQKPCTICPD